MQALKRELSRLTMAFSEMDPGYLFRVNYYSSSDPSVTYFGIKTGNSNNDNRDLLIARRLEMATVGDENIACIPIVGESSLAKVTRSNKYISSSVLFLIMIGRLHKI